jgi:Family of unknown function (DUF6535)
MQGLISCSLIGCTIGFVLPLDESSGIPLFFACLVRTLVLSLGGARRVSWTAPCQGQTLQMPKSENKSKDEEMDEKKPQVPHNQPTPKGGLTQEHVPEATSEPARILGITKEYSGWDVYNNEARKVDNELVKDWTTSLNFLLIFVSFVPTIHG